MRAAARAAAVALPLAFLGVFFVLPLAWVLARGLSGGEGGSPLDVLVEPATLRVAWFTVWQAAASTALTLVVGLPLAWAVGRFDFRGRALVEAAVLVPFVLPTIVVATAFLALMPAGLDRGVVPILLAHVFFNVAVVVRIVGTAWARVDERLGDVAATLGAPAWRRAREVTLPLLAPGLSAASALVFLFCFTSFGVVVVLGGPERATLEVEIYNEALRRLDLSAAAALSLLQLAAVAAVGLVTARLEARTGTVRASPVPRRHPRGGERAAVAGVIALGAAALLVPPALLVRASLSTPAGPGLQWFHALFEETPALLVEPWRALPASLAFAAVSTVIAVTVGGLAAWAVARSGRSARLDALVVLPLGASATMLGLGYLLAFAEPPFALRGSIWLIPLVQSLVALPFVVRIVAPALRSVDQRLREAAAVLGAAPHRVWREIDLPVVGRALAAAAGLAFAISLGEFGATVFLARADWPTLPVAIFRFLGRPGAENAGIAAALSVVLMAATALVVLAIDRLSGRRRAF